MNAGSLILAGALAVTAVGITAYMMLPAPLPPAAVQASPMIIKEHRTVSWFVANPEVMRATLSGCKNDPGPARFDAECQNANRASLEVYLAKARIMAGLDE